mmetsp:Transcript_3780/g.9518  ORF Transcript_3780/g.9518 Transcript_3780/m.9518 type:complete len:307 (+) Transcript_3780:693-1613(+)
MVTTWRGGARPVVRKRDRRGANPGVDTLRYAHNSSIATTEGGMSRVPRRSYAPCAPGGKKTMGRPESSARCTAAVSSTPSPAWAPNSETSAHESRLPSSGTGVSNTGSRRVCGGAPSTPLQGHDDHSATSTVPLPTHGNTPAEPLHTAKSNPPDTVTFRANRNPLALSRAQRVRGDPGAAGNGSCTVESIRTTTPRPLRTIHTALAVATVVVKRRPRTAIWLSYTTTPATAISLMATCSTTCPGWLELTAMPNRKPAMETFFVSANPVSPAVSRSATLPPVPRSATRRTEPQLFAVNLRASAPGLP